MVNFDHTLVVVCELLNPWYGHSNISAHCKSLLIYTNHMRYSLKLLATHFPTNSAHALSWLVPNSKFLKLSKTLFLAWKIITHSVKFPSQLFPTPSTVVLIRILLPPFRTPDTFLGKKAYL